MTPDPELYLSFDIEDWHQVPFATPYLTATPRHRLESVVVAGTERILALLNKYDVKATFFVVGEVADAHPELVQQIVADGHEVGCHGYAHIPISDMTPEAFEADLQRGVDVIRRITGTSPAGFRAPLASIGEREFWAIDIIRRTGFRYDSSIYPPSPFVHRALADIPPAVHEIVAGLWEVPLTVERWLGLGIPLSGGFYIRVLPERVYRHLLNRHMSRGEPAVVYFHSWEFETAYPRVVRHPLKRFVQYHNLESIERKLEKLLGMYRFRRLSDALPPCAD